ncbi:MAG TPA: TonB family protein [Candidatus Cloacimonadota bacterium]|nr:TonB family protein [Candidatus Cloacimonadota bacterium]HOV15922.1 TonB family protein [Candidatus Cloacimonadota bacterium]HQL14283.1 TonB family protein [Candidatus Cloacimonadota bacterium]
MKINKINGIDNYLISVLLHLILFFSLGFITIKQSEQAHDLVVELSTPENPVTVRKDFTKFGSATAAIEEDYDYGSAIISGRSNVPSAENQASETEVGTSIEPPKVKPTARINSSPISGSTSGYLSGVKSQLGIGGTGSSGYQMEDEGGNISVLYSVLPSPQITDYGTVRLQFRIRKDGTVDSDSVVPIILDDPTYTDAAIEALKQWRFSVKNFSGTKTYRITFIFKPESR